MLICVGDGGEDEEQREAAFSRAQSLQPEPETAIWRLLQGKGARGAAQGRSAAGRLDFILQARILGSRFTWSAEAASCIQSIMHTWQLLPV